LNKFKLKFERRLPYVCESVYLQTGGCETRALIIPLPIPAG